MIDPREISDEELHAARSAWERDRPRLWASVERLRGRKYQAAFAEYMGAKARADALTAEARRRGVRKRRTGSAANSVQTEFKYAVSTSGQAISAVASGPVRYPERERLALRDELRRAVSGLRIAPGQVLRGTFAGALPPKSKTDVENRVLLNIGLFERCLRHGFAFEHNPRAPAGWRCGYDYRAVAANDPFELWQPSELLGCWNDVALEHGLTAAAIWWAVRNARNAASNDASDGGPLLLRTEVASPRPLAMSQLKAVADGVIAAAQWTARVRDDGAERLAANLAAAGIPTDVEHIVELLSDPAGAGAGQCDDLVARDGRVDPDDHLVVAGLVQVWIISGSVPRLRARVDSAVPMSPESA